MIKVLLSFFLAWFIGIFTASAFDKLEWPYIINYPKNRYDAEKQNWSIARGEAGTMYFGNSRGLLSFNGQSWKVHPMPNNTPLRAIAADGEGRIYAGSYEEFGYWKETGTGILVYHSLTPHLSNFNFHNEEIWKIIIHDNKVYFQAFSKVFIYNGKRISILNPSGLISCFTKAGDRILVHIAGKGLYVMDGTNLRMINNASFFREIQVREILSHGKDEWLIATFDRGIYRYNRLTNTFRPWENERQQEMIDMRINRAETGHMNQVIVGTILNGIYVLNRKGELVQQINQDNGLQNNTILSLFYTSEHQLWVGTDNGIDLIPFDSEVSFFRDFSGDIGTVFTMLTTEDKLYLGSNRGLFYSGISTGQTGIARLDFKLIEHSQGQVWSLHQFGDQLFCGHNNGAFMVMDNQLAAQRYVNGGFDMEKITVDGQTYLIQSTYTYLVVFKRQQQQWVFSHYVEGFVHPIKYLEVDHLGNIWAGHLLKGLYKLRLDKNLKKIVSEQFLGKEDGFSSDYFIKAFSWNKRVVFVNEGRAYTYSDLQERIIPYELPFRDRFKNDRIQKVFQFDDRHSWFITDKRILLYRLQGDEFSLWKVYPLDIFREKTSMKDMQLYPVDSTHALLNLNEGVAYITPGFKGDNPMTQKPVQLNTVMAYGRDEQYLPLKQGEDIPQLPNPQNSILFAYSYPEFGERIRFNVRLSPIDTSWQVTEENEKRYDRLPPGNYTFHVMARDTYNYTSGITTWGFTIKPPFYYSIWAKGLYILLLAGSLLYIRKYYRKRLKKQEARMQAEKERALMEMKNRVLQEELQRKSEQLADTTFSMIKKNEMLMNIRDILSRTRRISPGSTKNINNTLNLIDRNISNEDDWKLFESNFEQAHKDFLDRIKREFPDLNPNDLKLCAFLRMNLSSKKIGLLLGISTRSVENHRYRLRKKMGMHHEDNLTEFILNF